jgi:hypothetical protein
MSGDQLQDHGGKAVASGDTTHSQHAFGALFDQYRNGGTERTTTAQTGVDYVPAHPVVDYLPSPNSRPANSNLRPGEVRPTVSPAAPADVSRPTAVDTPPLQADTSPVVMAPDTRFGPQAASPDTPVRRGNAPESTPAHAPAQPIRSSTDGHTVGSDSYFKGDRATMGHFGYTVHALIDGAAIAGGALTANNMVKNSYDYRFIENRTSIPTALESNALRDVQALMRRAHAPEITSLNAELSGVARNLGMTGPLPSERLVTIPTGTLTEAERASRSRLATLTSGAVSPERIAAAEEAAATPELKQLIRSNAENLAQAGERRTAALAEAEGISRAMTRGSLMALGIGEAANVGMDYTLFSGTPHTLRTALFDAAAPFVVLSPLSTRLKLATIVGTHVINRIWDANTKDAGKI